MLSTAAWNAFLKTLEEPPPNTVFVLATTERAEGAADRRRPLSPLRLPAPDDRADRDRRSTASRAAEWIVIGAEAVAVLARHAAGSFRDALGTLEQLQTYAGLGDRARRRASPCSGSPMSSSSSRRSTRSPAADPRRALETAAAAVDGGHDPAAFIRELETHARELLIVALARRRRAARAGAHAGARRAPVGPRRRRCRLTALVRTLDLLADALGPSSAGADARTQLELALVSAARADLDPTLAALGARIERSSTAPRRSTRWRRRSGESKARPARPATQDPADARGVPPALPVRDARRVRDAGGVANAGGARHARRAECVGGAGAKGERFQRAPRDC